MHPPLKLVQALILGPVRNPHRKLESVSDNQKKGTLCLYCFEKYWSWTFLCHFQLVILFFLTAFCTVTVDHFQVGLSRPQAAFKNRQHPTLANITTFISFLTIHINWKCHCFFLVPVISCENLAIGMKTAPRFSAFCTDVKFLSAIASLKSEILWATTSW